MSLPGRTTTPIMLDDATLVPAAVIVPGTTVSPLASVAVCPDCRLA